MPVRPGWKAGTRITYEGERVRVRMRMRVRVHARHMAQLAGTCVCRPPAKLQRHGVVPCLPACLLPDACLAPRAAALPLRLHACTCRQGRRGRAGRGL